MSKLLLDGSEMKAEEFYKKFEEYVGMTYSEWEKLPTTKYGGGSETYEYRDDKFVLGGTAYSEPKLYSLT